MINVTLRPRPLTAWQALADEFYSYLALTDGEIEQRFADRIHFEHRLPEPERYMAALLRLEAWLDLAEEDARVLARAYDRALDRLPVEYRLASDAAERAALLNGLSFRDFQALAGIVPRFRDESSTFEPDLLEPAAA
jgi:hypothetical protein